MAVTNGSCADELTNQAHTRELSVYGLIHSSSCVALAVISVVLWVSNYNLPYLKKRSFGSLLTVLTLGFILQQFAGGFRRWLEDDLSCEIATSAYYLCLPWVIWPLCVRLRVYSYRLDFHYSIAKEVGINGVAELDTKDVKFWWPRFWASSTYAVIANLSILLPYSIAVAVLVVESSCRRCEGLTDIAFFFFAAFVALGTVSAVSSLWRSRRDPDNVGMRLESKWTFGMAWVLGMPAAIMVQFDVGGFEAASPTPFSWGILIDLAFLVVFIIVVPLQVWYAKHPKKKEAGDEDNFKQLLNSEGGYRFFQLYLATELSIENLLFWEAVTDWKEQTENGGLSMDASHLVAKQIYHTYIKTGDMEVNISGKASGEIRDFFEGNNSTMPAKIPLDIFDDAHGQIYGIMLNGSYPNFKASDLYKLYSGDIDLDDVQWIESSGLTSFAMMDANNRPNGSTVPKKKAMDVSTHEFEHSMNDAESQA